MTARFIETNDGNNFPFWSLEVAYCCDVLVVFKVDQKEYKLLDSIRDKAKLFYFHHSHDPKYINYIDFNTLATDSIYVAIHF